MIIVTMETLMKLMAVLAHVKSLKDGSARVGQHQTLMFVLTTVVMVNT